MNTQWLTKEYYLSMQERYNCWPQTLSLMLDAVDEVNASPELQEIFWHLVKVLEHPDTWDDSLRLPTEYHMLAALAFGAYMPQMVEGMVADGFPMETAVKTAQEIDAAVMEAALSNKGKPGLSLDLIKWYKARYLHRNMFRLGRFSFERNFFFDGHVAVYRNAKNEEVAFSYDIAIGENGDAAANGGTEAFYAKVWEEDGFICGHKIVDGRAQKEITRIPKAEWTRVLCYGDPVIHIHVPSFEPFTPEYMEQSYQDGIAMLKKVWKDFPATAIVGVSWILNPRLGELLRPDSNLLYFQRKYTPFPEAGNTESALELVFFDIPEDLHDLPEKTSLQRKLKEMYLKGDGLYTVYSYWIL